MLQQAGFKSSGSSGGLDRPHYCNIPVPFPQPCAPKDAPMVERLFIVSQPEQFPDSYLTDLLCRFGNLIDAYFLPGIILLVITHLLYYRYNIKMLLTYNLGMILRFINYI